MGEGRGSGRQTAVASSPAGLLCLPDVLGMEKSGATRRWWAVAANDCRAALYRRLALISIR